MNNGTFNWRSGQYAYVDQGNFFFEKQSLSSFVSQIYTKTGATFINLGVLTVFGSNCYIEASKDANQGAEVGKFYNVGRWKIPSVNSAYLSWRKPGDFYQCGNGVFEVGFPSGLVFRLLFILL